MRFAKLFLMLFCLVLAWLVCTPVLQAHGGNFRYGSGFRFGGYSAGFRFVAPVRTYYAPSAAFFTPTYTYTAPTVVYGSPFVSGYSGYYTAPTYGGCGSLLFGGY